MKKTDKKIKNEDRVKIIAKKIRKGLSLRFLEVHNGLSAIIAEDIKNKKDEFDGFWESSLTDSASKGLPDVEIVSFDSRLETINQILGVTKKSMIVDGDTGGDFNQFEYMIERLERNGVSMVVIEDKIFPKRNSLESGTRQELEDPEFFAEKIKRGQAVKNNDNFLIVARIESLIAGMGQEDAINRAKIYLKAGADGILIHSKKENPKEILEFSKRFKKLPEKLIKGKILACIPTTYNTITERELNRAGFNVIIYANHLLRSSYLAMEKVAKEILIRGRSFEADSYCVGVRELFNKVGFLKIKKKDEEFTKKHGSKIKIIIPAAGEDSLSNKYQRPKTLIDIMGKNILQRQIETFQKVTKLSTFIVIRGYKKNLFDIENIHYCDNDNYKNEYILSSLFCAKDWLNSSFIFSYADLILSENIIRSLLKVIRTKKSPDIILVVDDAFKYYKNQKYKVLDLVKVKGDPTDSIRKITDDFGEEVITIGSKLNRKLADYEFIGVAYFSKKGTKILKEVYYDSLNKYKKKPFQGAKNIYFANLTDIIQEIIDRGYKVKILKTFKGWMEIDDEKDLALAKNFYKND
jgi:phosphoenolpyruvate phosphomutase